MARKGYVNMTLTSGKYDSLVKEFERLKIHDKTGKKFTQWVTEQIEFVLAKEEFLKRIAPSLALITINEDSLLLRDQKTQTIFEIRLRDGSLVCVNDDSQDCKHVKFAALLNEIGGILQTKFKK